MSDDRERSRASDDLAIVLLYDVLMADDDRTLPPTRAEALRRTARAAVEDWLEATGHQ